MSFKLPDLPYPKNALEPHVSHETLEYHHGKHHAAYVKKLNELVEGTEFARMELEEVVRSAGPGPLFNNAAQHWNHTFLWQCMSNDGGAPRGALAERIDRSFGGIAKLEKEFHEAAMSQFGTGWAWLVEGRDGSLEVESTQDAETPIAKGKRVLLTCDVWEHAYYIDYRDARAKYLDSFRKIVNWEFVGRNLAVGGKTAAAQANGHESV